MLTIEKMQEYGANVEEGLGRCMGVKELYVRLCNVALEDRNFTALNDAAAEQNWNAAFEAAHGLKGMLENLAITPLAEPVHTLTEKLRPRVACDCQPELGQINERLQTLKKLAAE